VVEVGGETLVLLVRIIADVSFDGGRPPVPRAKAAEPGWTGWRGHDIVVYAIELYTCPRFLGVGVSRVLQVCRWQGKYDCTPSEELVADHRIYGEGAEEEGGDRWVSAVNRR
jgi:hypothetical protein